MKKRYLYFNSFAIFVNKARTRSDILRKTDLITMPLSRCNATVLEYNQQRNEKPFRNGVSETQYCAYDPEGRKDSCEGDSGGPLQIIPHNSNIAKVVGVVSFGIACGSPFPGIYTRVASYVDWIESHVWPDGKIAAPMT